MGGMMKGGYAYSSRRRWMNVYVAMAVLCLVFGCGVLGVMGLNRLKERRFLNLLIKQKDDQILSLRQLLQKEREEMQEMKRKREEMKMKIYRLAGQKTELNGRVLEMQSEISSLRDEEKAIESAYQDIQNEAKLLRNQIQDQKALTQSLQHKDAQIQDLKHQLQLNTGAEDQHPILTQNSTPTANVSANDAVINENNTERNMQNEQQQRREDDGKSISGTKELETSSGNGRGGQDVTGVEKKENETDKIRDEDREAQFTDSKGFSTGMSKIDVHKGLVKLEIQENSHRFRVKQLKGKRWRPTAKQTDGRSWQSNGASTIRNQATVEGVEEIGNKPRNLDEYQNSLQNEPVSKDAVQGRESSGEGSEQSIIKPEENTSHIAGKQNVSRISVNEQSKEQESAITEDVEDDNGHRLRQNEVAEDAEGEQMERLEESDDAQTKKPYF